MHKNIALNILSIVLIIAITGALISVAPQKSPAGMQFLTSIKPIPYPVLPVQEPARDTVVLHGIITIDGVNAPPYRKLGAFKYDSLGRLVRIASGQTTTNGNYRLNFDRNTFYDVFFPPLEIRELEPSKTRPEFLVTPTNLPPGKITIIRMYVIEPKTNQIQKEADCVSSINPSTIPQRSIYADFECGEKIRAVPTITDVQQTPPECQYCYPDGTRCYAYGIPGICQNKCCAVSS